VRLAIAATPRVAIPTLEALLLSSHEIALVITQPDRPAGRGRELTPTDVSQWADLHAIRTIKPESSNELLSELDDIDCVVTIGYGVLLPLEVLRIPRYGFINLHFSLLPQWRGAAPVQRSIEAGDRVTGVTVFQLDQGMDTGPIYISKEVPLDPQWNSGQALDVLAKAGAGAVLDTLTMIASGAKPHVQSDVGQSRARKLSSSEGEIDWNTSAGIIRRKVLAFTPAPGAWTTFRGAHMKIVDCEISDSLAKLEPGELLGEEGNVLVGTGDRALRLVQIIPSGKSSMSAGDWLRGARVVTGDHLG
jgi:methionyl-tRNA formyltransferase